MNRPKLVLVGLIIVLVFMLGKLSMEIVFSQNKSQQVQPKEQRNRKTFSSEQAVVVQTILSNYKNATLTASQASEIQENFKKAGIHAGPECNEAIVAAGFDPEKLRILSPAVHDDKKERPSPPSSEEKLKEVETKILIPLSLNSTQTDQITKAYTDFFQGVENLKRSQPQGKGRLDKAAIEPLQKVRDEKIRTILPAGKFAKYRELEKLARPPKPAEDTVNK